MDAVLGPGAALEQRRFGRSRVHAVIGTGARLDHYLREWDRPDRPWLRVGTVTDRATGPGVLARVAGGFVVRVPEAGGPTTYRLTGTGWARDVAFSAPDPANRLDSPSAEDLGVNSRHLRAVAVFSAAGRPQALTDEGGSVFHYQLTGSGRWERASCLRLADTEPFGAGPESVKVAQVTGDRDATPTPWGERLPTLSNSLTTAGIRGTDLGVRVEHAGRSLLLFGDTHWTRPWLATRDAIAEVTPAGPLPGLPGVRFHGSPLKLTGGRATMREYDVPLDGFSHAGRLYAFFTSDHFRQRRVMGRSVLTVAGRAPVIDPAARRRPVRFEVLGTFSDRHFINVSVQLRPAAGVPGCAGDGEVLLVWGSGPYRAAEPRLALLDQAALGRLARGEPPSRLGVRYWAGLDGDRPRWSDAEGDARPLFAPAALGELSVRWVPAAERYLLLSASGPEDPIGAAITLRTAQQPWGPWSQRTRLLDWVTTGMAVDPHTRFIKSHQTDPVGDRVFRGQARVTGAAYAPYLFDAETDGEDLVLRYTLSTWNPYQVVLMRHRLPLR